MKINFLLRVFVFSALVLLCFGKVTDAQTYFPNSATIDYYVGDGAVLGYANATDASNKKNGTSPTVNLVNGGDVENDFIQLYNGSILNASGGSCYGAVVDDSSTVNLSGGTCPTLYAFSNSSVNVSGGTCYDLMASNNSSVKINGGNINSLSTQDDSMVNITSGIVNNISSSGNSAINIMSGNMSGGRSYDSSTINVNGGDYNGFESDNNSKINFVNGNILNSLYAGDNSTININGGNIYGSGGFFYGVGAYGSSSVNISGGSINALLATDASIVTINGGTINGDIQADNSSVINISGGSISGGAINANSTSAIKISGGKFSYYPSIEAYDSCTVAISGGTISGLVSDDSSAVSISGGNFVHHDSKGYASIYAFASSAINLTGTNLSGVLIDYGSYYSEYVLFGNLKDGSSVNGLQIYVANGTGAKLTLNGLSPDNGMLLTLANIATDVYSASLVDWGQFTALGDNTDFIPVQASDKGFRAGVYVDADYSQFVIGYRGTDPDDGKMVLFKNLFADGSYITNLPSPNFSKYIAEAANLVQTVHNIWPKASITLTGHSLGGGIAELVGYAAGLTTVTFNAPGPNYLYSQLTTQLAPATAVQGQSAALVNYRLQHEQISLINYHLGSTVTLPDPQGTMLSLTTPIADLSTYLNLHKMTTVIPQLGETPVDGSGDLFTLSPLRYAFLGVLAFFDEFTFGFLVTDYGLHYLDPTPGSDYVFTGKSGSPLFASIVLPTFDGIATYKLRYQVGNTWSNYQSVAPGVQVTLPQAANAIEYLPFDAYGMLTVIPDDFYFAASFASTGTFNGTLAVSNTQATVTGQIALDSVPNLAQVVYPIGNVTFEFRTPGTSPYGKPATPALFVKTGTLTPDGTNPGLGDYTLTGVTPGTYDIAIKGGLCLRKVVKNVTITGSAGTIPLVSLLGGDANNDNSIDSSDFGVLIGSFNTSASIPGSGYDPTADFNFDGSVDSSDFGELIGNYNKVGDL